MRLLCCLLSGMVLVLSSCGDSTSPTPVINEGNWAGITYDDDAITFVVRDGSVDSLQAVIICVFGAFADTVTWNAYDVNINNNYFFTSESVGTSPSYFFSVGGTFNPPNNVSGMFVKIGAYANPDSIWFSDSASWEGSHQ